MARKNRRSRKKTEYWAPPAASASPAAPSTSVGNVSNHVSGLVLRNKPVKEAKRNIVKEFDAYFGANNLENWKKLCRDVGVDSWEQLSNIRQCHQVNDPHG